MTRADNDDIEKMVIVERLTTIVYRLYQQHNFLEL